MVLNVSTDGEGGRALAFQLRNVGIHWNLSGRNPHVQTGDRKASLNCGSFFSALGHSKRTLSVSVRTTPRANGLALGHACRNILWRHRDPHRCTDWSPRLTRRRRLASPTITAMVVPQIVKTVGRHMPMQQPFLHHCIWVTNNTAAAPRPWGYKAIAQGRPRLMLPHRRCWVLAKKTPPVYKRCMGGGKAKQPWVSRIIHLPHRIPHLPRRIPHLPRTILPLQHRIPHLPRRISHLPHRIPHPPRRIPDLPLRIARLPCEMSLPGSPGGHREAGQLPQGGKNHKACSPNRVRFVAKRTARPPCPVCVCPHNSHSIPTCRPARGI